jgi:ABC-type branched-subunit amino acid transport system ATPase component/ABC-type branched-subunit amino acid transport system permease subunit
MNTFLQLAILGVGAGAGYAMIAHGIVLIYRGSGTLNFAQGAVAMMSAQVFYGLRDDRQLNAWLSFVVTMLVAASIGVGMQMLVLRPLRKSSALVRLVATLALLTICMGLASLWWGKKSAQVDGILPAKAAKLTDGITVPVDRAYLFVIVLLITGVLTVVYERTRFGLATAGAAENERAATTLGWSPAFLGGANWAAGCVLAALAGILLAPIAGLSIRGMTLTVVAGMAAALIGGFSSFWLTMCGALAIGVTQSLIVKYLPEPGAQDAVPFLAITLLVMIRGQALPLRGELLERPVKVGSGRPARWVPILVVGSIVLVYSLSREWTLAVATSLPIAIVGLSYVVITGYAGQISLAQLTIAGVGAWFAGVSSYYWELPMPVCLVFATLAAIVAGTVAGLPALRCRGMNLAVVTLGMSVVIETMVLGNKRWAGGFAGLEIFSSDAFGAEMSFGAEPKRFTLLALGMFIVAAYVVANVRRSQSGRRLLAIRSNERAAASLGINVTGGKLFAFTLGSALAGFGGALAAFQFPTVALGSYNTIGSITMLLNTVVGGVGFVFGGVQAGLSAHSGVVSYVISHFSASAIEWLVVISAVTVFLTILTQPDGIASHVAHSVDAARKRFGRDRSADVLRLGTHAAAADDIVGGLALTARGISVSYGGVRALEDVDVEVQPGQVLGIIGPNGAGKTTLIDALCGFTKASGIIELGDGRIDRLNAAARARAGLARTFQAVELFDDMSLLENVQVATDCANSGHGLNGYLRDLVWPRKQPLPRVAVTALTEFGLTDSLALLPSELPAGRQRLAGIARALSTEPRVICLDEPAAGLSDLEAEELARLVRNVAEQWKLSVIVIEHNVQFVRTVSDRMVALDQGRLIASGTPDEVLRSPAVIAAYTGEAPDESDAVAPVGVSQ